MPQRSPNRVTLDFLNEWDQGSTPSWQDYKDDLANCTGDAGEMLDLVADCVIFEALVSPQSLWKTPACLR